MTKRNIAANTLKSSHRHLRENGFAQVYAHEKRTKHCKSCVNMHKNENI